MSKLRYKISEVKTFILFDDYGYMKMFEAKTLIEARQANPDSMLIKELNEVKRFIDQYEYLIEQYEKEKSI